MTDTLAGNDEGRVHGRRPSRRLGPLAPGLRVLVGSPAFEAGVLDAYRARSVVLPVAGVLLFWFSGMLHYLLILHAASRQPERLRQAERTAPVVSVGWHATALTTLHRTSRRSSCSSSLRGLACYGAAQPARNAVRSNAEPPR